MPLCGTLTILHHSYVPAPALPPRLPSPNIASKQIRVIGLSRTPPRGGAQEVLIHDRRPLSEAQPHTSYSL